MGESFFRARERAGGQKQHAHTHTQRSDWGDRERLATDSPGIMAPETRSATKRKRKEGEKERDEKEEDKKMKMKVKTELELEESEYEKKKKKKKKSAPPPLQFPESLPEDLYVEIAKHVHE